MRRAPLVAGRPSHLQCVARVAAFRETLDWHPSEATAQLAAAALGMRGRVEVRDSGPVVPLTDRSASVCAVSLADAVKRNRLASALIDSRSLVESDPMCRSLCGFSEIDYERARPAGGAWCAVLGRASWPRDGPSRPRLLGLRRASPFVRLLVPLLGNGTPARCRPN
ncbi:MAG: DUF1152 domain-containing protein [Acidimicrobiales bacterium]